MPSFLENLNSPFASEAVTVSNAVKQLTAATYNNTSAISGGASAQAFVVPRKARGARITLDGANSVRYTLDGTTPVATTTGNLLSSATSPLLLESYEQIVKFKAIREGGSDGILQVTYFR